MHLESTPTWLIGPEIPPTQRIGTVLSGSYRLDAFLGQGMTGVTYNAWHLRQKQPYAVKLLHRELQPSHERVSRLRQDLRTLSGLRRFGFLPVELSFAPDGAPFLACELLTGETLRNRLGRGPLPVLATGIVTAALARALGEAHQQGIVHGDLRPENVLLPSEAGREIEAGQPVLLDAALHHLRRRPIGLDESLPIGKLVYLAPEQASGEQQTADAGGDIFALGAILYECLTGRQAFAGPELEVVLEKLAAPPQKLALPREVGAPPGLGEALDEVIAKACARDPAERYASMAELLAALDKAFTQCGLPLPPPDERVPIDTVKAQNRELRKRTVVVKKVVPLAPMTELPETSGVMSAASFAHLSALMTSSSTPEPGEAAPAGSAEPGTDKPADGKRITAKNRVVRRTVRARDLSRLLNQIESGQLDVAQAMALAAKAEDEPEPDDAAPEPAGEAKSEAQRIIDEGRAAVIARAEAAKKNRESDTKERQQRDQAAAQEMQRRLLEQARQETLGRMRAEWELSRPVTKLTAKDLAAEPARPAAKPDPQQAELLAEAQRQAQRLEAERTDAERSAAEEAAKVQAEAQAAEAGRKEAARLEADLRAAERREAERAEALRRQAELEIKARQLAEQAEQARAAKQAEADARHKEAEEARQAAEAKQLEAAVAKQAAEVSDEAALWEDGFDLLLSEEQPDRTIPPPIPIAAMRARTEAARRAEAEAERARAEATAAAAVAQQASSDAAEIEQQVVAARRAQEEAAAARDREAAELAAAVEAAEDVRAQDQALFRQVMDAEKRAKVAEAARKANVARVTRVTQALHVIRQVQTLVEDEPPSEPAASAAPASVNSAANSADTGRFRRPLDRPAGGERVEPVSAVPDAPVSQLSNEITGRTAVPILAANASSAPETSSGYASFQVSPAAAKEGSGAYAAAPPAAAGIRVPDPIAQSAQTAQPIQSTRSPARPAQPDPSAGYSAAPLAAGMRAPDPRADQSTGYTAAQLAAAGIRAPDPRADQSTGYTAAQLAAAGVRAPDPRADQSTGHTAAQLAAAGMRAPDPRADQSTGYTAAQLAAAGIRAPDSRADQSASYTAAQLAAAGLRPPDPAVQAAPPGSTTGSSAWAVQPDPRAELSAGYSAAQLAAGVRPDLSTGYTAAQLAAAGIRSPSQVLPQAMTPMIGQPLPSGMHPAMQLSKGGSASMPHISGGGNTGDYSAMLSSAGMSGIMTPGMGAAQQGPEPGGVTLTTRQLVATLAMTSVLSGVIGALIALLVLQNSYKPGEPALPPATAGGETPPGAARSDQPPERKSETPRPPIAPVAAKTAPQAVVSGSPDTLVLYRGTDALPPLRLASVAASGPPRPSQWTRPGGPPARPASPSGPGPGPGVKPDAVAPSRPTSPDGKPAADSSPAADSKPGAPGGKPAVKPSADQVGLRNPFSK